MLVGCEKGNVKMFLRKGRKGRIVGEGELLVYIEIGDWNRWRVRGGEKRGGVLENGGEVKKM